MSKIKVLVLGGSGFIGSSIVEKFSGDPKYEVTATVHHNLNKLNLNRKLIYHPVDLKDKGEVKLLFIKTSPDIVIHAAAVTTGSKDVIERPYLHVTDNVIMNSIVFEQAFLQKIKHVIFFSCTVMYQSNENPQKESDWSAGNEVYPSYFGVANMKMYSEKMCDFFSRLGITKYTAIRHSNVYGPRDKFDLDKCHVFPAMVNKICNAKDTLEVWGDGKASRDLIYIDDLVDFVDKCIQNQNSKYELFNCGAGYALSISEIIDRIKEAAGKDNLKLVYNNSKPNIPTKVVLNCDKAKDLLGWEMSTTCKYGAAKTVEWYKNHYLK